MSISTQPFLIIFFLAFPFHGQSQPANPSELSILLDLKSHWSSSSSSSFFTNWTTSSHHCNWQGVICTAAGAVTGIVIVDKNITVPIPASICDLRNLTHIELQFNYIPGRFPTVLYNCSNLQYLDLSQNYFIGAIPDNVSNLSPQLSYLNLEANNFTGDIPPAIGGLPGLVTLRLNANLFNGKLPAEIGDLANLENLVLSNNTFANQWIPSSFGRMKKLRNLWARSANFIGGIPEEIGNMSALESLDFSYNRLNGSIPDGVFRLQNLRFLYLFKNKLSGPIPRKIEASNLLEIDLSNNDLTGTIPDDFGKLTNLTSLALFSNQLSGQVPLSIARLPNLFDLSIFSNNLSGELPPDLGLYSTLARLEFSENRFTGQLPKHMCANRALIGVIAFGNNLTGGLPDDLGNCSSLQIIRAHDNRLSGEVPGGLWTSVNLTMLMLGNNSFVGQLPNRIGPNLSLLELMDNRFSGPIPIGISSWRSLQEFKISNNLLSGEIPEEFTALSSLSIAVLDGNQLSGHLPSNIISWTSLSTLDLSRNRLSGEIPRSFARLRDLFDLDLSENELSGEIPPEIGNLRLPSLNLSSNRLTGRIPQEYDNAAFDTSFLNNPGLCSNTQSLGINRCKAQIAKKSDKLSSKFVAAVSSIAVVAFVVAFLYTVFLWRSYRKRKHDRDSNWKLTSFQRLNFTERNILSSLTDENLIGSGGSGRVYCVSMRHSGEHVAVKRIWNNARLDQKLEKEFQAEVEILGTIRHSNIVKLYCCISSETSKLLVYEYMENRSLDRWLHNKTGSYTNSGSVHHVVLDWPKRLHIAIGAAQGLCYMHHQCSPPIIHRDVKSSNILLDSQFNPKIADFGLARMLIRHGEPNTMSIVAGSFGYLAPEYYQTRKVSEKVDVYSFGVILLELITGREAHSGDETSSLADWAWHRFRNGVSTLADDDLDDDIKEAVYLDEIERVLKLGLMCTSRFPSSRPSMKGVLEVLLQCTFSQSPHGKNAYRKERDIAPLLQNSKPNPILETDSDDVFTSI